MTFAVIAHYRCAADDAALVTAALLAMREQTQAEPGNLAYVLHRDEPDPAPPVAAFTLYEQYLDRAAFEAHTASAHFAEHILGTVRPLLTGRTVHFCAVL